MLISRLKLTQLFLLSSNAGNSHVLAGVVFSSVSVRLLRCRLNLKVNALIVGKVPITIFVLHLPV